jgi:inward rectifier potassium channel
MAEIPPPPKRPPVRLVTRTGGFNVVRLGLSKQWLGDIYHLLLTTSWPRFFALIASVYIAVNSLFAVAYMVGDHPLANAHEGSFIDMFFFSIQTMSTIGYGSLSPQTLYANILVSIEALVGLLSTAMATGLLFAKFARPSARVMFSRVAIMTTRDGVPSLLFRMANERANQIVEAQLRLVLARTERTQEGEQLRRFYDLTLSRSVNAIFALSWTAVHPITPDSPLHGQTPESMRASDSEVIVSLIGFDETFSQTIHARYGYVADDLEWNVRFMDVISIAEDGRRTIDYTRFHSTIPIETKPAIAVAAG